MFVFFRKVLGQSHAPLAQEYAKKGVPLSYRAKIWTQILNVSVDDIVSAFFFENSFLWLVLERKDEF